MCSPVLFLAVGGVVAVAVGKSGSGWINSASKAGLESVKRE